MNWLDEGSSCSRCYCCGMDMDMTPFCVNNAVLEAAKVEDDRAYPFGLNINPARLICKGELFVPMEDGHPWVRDKR